MIPPNSFYTSTPPFKKLYLFGAGGFAREVAWLVEQSWGQFVEVYFVVDDTKYIKGSNRLPPIVLASDIFRAGDSQFVVAVGDPALRRKSAALLKEMGIEEATIVHPRAEISRSVEIGRGTIVCAGSIITDQVRLGEHVHVNLGCTIGHDVVIEEYSTLSPGVHLSGNVHIGTGVFLGTGVSVINGTAEKPLKIGDGAVVAAGSCVIGDVSALTMVAGVPAVHKRNLLHE